METIKATIQREEDKSATLKLHVEKEPWEIDLSNDQPNAIKVVFNKLILRLKDGYFEFKLEDEQEDLYSNICAEYIKQLNSELSAVYYQLSDYNLLSDKHPS
jgi:hypothetical protein